MMTFRRTTLACLAAIGVAALFAGCGRPHHIHAVHQASPIAGKRIADGFGEEARTVLLDRYVRSVRTKLVKDYRGEPIDERLIETVIELSQELFATEVDRWIGRHGSLSWTDGAEDFFPDATQKPLPEMLGDEVLDDFRRGIGSAVSGSLPLGGTVDDQAVEDVTTSLRSGIEDGMAEWACIWHPLSSSYRWYNRKKDLWGGPC